VLTSNDFKRMVLEDMDRVANEHSCSTMERPKKIFLVSEPFAFDNNLLTPTFKLKRSIAKEYFKEQINNMYSEGIKFTARSN